MSTGNVSRRGGFVMRSFAIGGLLALILAAAGAPGAAQAQSGGQEGTTEIWSVQAGRGTVVLGGKTYRVGDQTRLQDQQGNRILLIQLPSLDAGANADAAAAWFEAQEGNGTTPALLYQLQLTGHAPR
jgi:hypothetical protein